MDQVKNTQPHVLVRAVRGIGRFIRGFFVAIGILVTVGPLVAIYIASHPEEVDKVTHQAPHIDSKAKLLVTLRLSGTIAETQPDYRFEILNRFLGAPSPLYIPDLVKALDLAAAAPQVMGLYVEVSGLKASFAAMTELRQALARFKNSGKPISLQLTDADTKVFYLSSVADKVSMAPAGSLEVPGPLFNLVYLGSALNKLGVDFQVVKAGKFKSAFEPLTADDPSTETLMVYKDLEESLRAHIVNSVAPAKKKELWEVRNWFRRGLFTADEALAQGLVDVLAYPADFEAEVYKQTGADQRMRLSTYASIKTAEKGYHPTEEIALIEAAGEITMFGDGDSDGENITPQKLNKALRWAREDKNIKAVVFRIVSPGGSALASDLIWNEVKKLGAAKPVVVSMGSVAASGGYYIAAPATRIFAEPTTITGSIGVIAGFPKLTGFKEKWGLSFHTISQTDRVNLYAPNRKASAEDEQVLGSQIEHTYKGFVTKVAEGRKLDVQKVFEIAEGRVYTGARAKDLGLVDELGGVNDAYRAAIELAKLDVRLPYPLVSFDQEKTLFDCLKSFSHLKRCTEDDSDADDEDGEVRLALGHMLQPEAPRALRTLKSLLARERVLTRLPFITAEELEFQGGPAQP